MAEHVIGLAAKPPTSTISRRAALQRLGDGELTVGRVLLGGGCSGAPHARIAGASSEPEESKSPTQSSGIDAKRRGMRHAAIGGDDAGAGDLAAQARRDGEARRPGEWQIGTWSAM